MTLALGLLSFFAATTLATVLTVRYKAPQGFTVTVLLVGLASVWVIPNAGRPGRMDIPGFKMETLAERAEKAADTAVASKEEVERLTTEVRVAQQYIQRVHQEMRLAFKAMVETTYLSIATRNFFPPPANVLERMLKGLDTVAIFAFPDPREREPWIKEMQAIVNAAQNPPAAPKP
jgi:hypothetical protein